MKSIILKFQTLHCQLSIVHSQLLLLALLLAACSSDPLGSKEKEGEEQDTPLVLTIKTRADSNAQPYEQDLKRVRLLVFNATGVLEANKLFEGADLTKEANGDYTIKATLQLSLGKKKMHLVGNETAALRTQLESTTLGYDNLMASETIVWNSVPAYPLTSEDGMPFTGTTVNKEEVQLVSGVNNVSFQLVRVVSRVEVRVVKQTGNSQTVTLKSVQMLRAAKQSRLLEGEDKTAMGGVNNWAVFNYSPVVSVTENAPTDAHYTAYLFENTPDVKIPNVGNRATTLRITCTVGGQEKSVDIPIKGNPRDLTQLAVQRNVIVKIKVTVEQDNIEVESIIVPWNKGMDEEIIFEGPFTLNLSHTNLRYAGDFGGGDATTTMERSVDVTAKCGTQGAKWKATSNVSWIRLLNTEGNADGSTTELKYTIEKDKTLSAERGGTITVTLGNVKKEIKITQYPGKAITESDVKSDYFGIDPVNAFKIKAKAPWTAKVEQNPDFFQLHVSAGTPNSNPITFQFTFLEAHQVITPYTFRFEEVNGEFMYYDVTVSIGNFFELGGLYVYPYDQEPRSSRDQNYSWYIYSNTPDGTLELSIPPTTGAQMSPPRPYSCAAIPSVPGKPWRLPTLVEARAMFRDSWGGGAEGSAEAKKSQARYNFLWDKYYWTSNTNIANVDGRWAENANSSKMTRGVNLKSIHYYLARCVRDK